MNHSLTALTSVAASLRTGIAGAMSVDVADAALTRRAAIILSTSLVFLLAHAFIPIEQFIHRGDDAYYYFKVAANFPNVGFWSFDTIHSTTGVQPLWAILLTALAQVLSWVGIVDPNVLARVFVAFTALLHFAAGMMLFYLLAKKVSTGTAVAAAGAFLFVPGLIWGRVWGMESSLYALLLTSTIAYFHLGFLEHRTMRGAVLLGVLLGLTALARLNAVFFVGCLILYFVWRTAHGPIGERLRLATVAGGVAGLFVVIFALSTYSATGHFLPVSGAAKALGTSRFLEERQIDTRFSLDFANALYDHFKDPVLWFITSRSMDATWVVGGRVLFNGDSRVPVATLMAAASLFVLAPLLAGRPRQWLNFLWGRFRRLSPFVYVLAFGAVDAIVSVFLYPTELGYAMVRWWFVENEIILVVASATLVAASVGYLGSRMFPKRVHGVLFTAVLVALVAFHSQETVRLYWSDDVVYPDWKLSANDEMYIAAGWLSENVPEDAIVGSWNAGILGYYATQRVVNLDGLINNYEFLPYLEQGRVSDYIKQEGISYVSDMSDMIGRFPVQEDLSLTEVYRHHSEFLNSDYLIYRVE